MQVWAVVGGALLNNFKTEESDVYSLAWSCGSEYLALAAGSSIVLWQTNVNKI
jgi:hypothetical protein